MDMMSDYDNLDVMLGNDDHNPIERQWADAVEQSSVQGDANTNTYHREEYGNFSYENSSMRQNDVRQSSEALSNEFNLRLSQEMDSMISILRSQINRAIITAIAERVIPEIQNIANSMSSAGHRDIEDSMSPPNSQENRENASGPKTKIAKKDFRSVGDFRDTTGCGSYTRFQGSDFRRNNMAQEIEANNKQVELTNGLSLTRSFYWSRAFFKTSYFSFMFWPTYIFSISK